MYPHLHSYLVGLSEFAYVSQYSGDQQVTILIIRARMLLLIMQVTFMFLK